MMIQNSKLKINNSSQGYIALSAVLVLGAIGTVLMLSLMLVGIVMSKTTNDISSSEQAKVSANSCAEEALKEIRLSTAYTGSDTLTFTNGSCIYLVINNGGQNRTVQATGISGNSTKYVLITIDSINPSIKIVKWEEVTNF